MNTHTNIRISLLIGLLLASVQLLAQIPASQPSANQNYILTRTYTSADGKHLDTYAYFDGLGRPIQTVQHAITPGGKDLVAIQEYDGLGREWKSWLPGVSANSTGAFVGIETARSQSITTNKGDNIPYSEIEYEASPLNRVSKQYGPGQQWRTAKSFSEIQYLTNVETRFVSSPSKALDKESDINNNAQPSSTGHKVISACDQIVLKAPFTFAATNDKSLTLRIDPTRCNQVEAVKPATGTIPEYAQPKYLTCTNFEVSAAGIINKGSYPSGELYVTLAIDENKNKAYEFKDKLGQVLLTRQINGADILDTYYIYDDFGNQRYVLPPLVADKTLRVASLPDTDPDMKDIAYIYKYDSRNRCIEKKLPGIDPIYSVYDKADQLIFVQDGEQRAKNEWIFNKYDAFGRLILTGLHTISKGDAKTTHTFLRTSSESIVVREQFDKNQRRQYTWNSLPTILPANGVKQVLLANYYDNYDFMWGDWFSPDELRYNHSYEDNDFNTWHGDNDHKYAHKGLLTATLTAVLNDSERYDAKVMYYDDRGRLIQSITAEGIRDDFVVECLSYNFVDQPLKKLHETFGTSGLEAVKELYTYTYDRAGRLTETRHQHNNNAPVLLAKNEYDDLGRLKSSNKNNSTLKTDYTYTIRSWTEAINTPNLLTQSLTYDLVGNINQYNWTQEQKARSYKYSYDNLSRLRGAVYTGEGKHNTAYSYDKMGNILTLSREGRRTDGTAASAFDLVDNLTMKYSGHQLINVHDAAAPVLLASSSDFKNGSTSTTAVEYTYNKNGAMKSDANKGIKSIEYNPLGMPSTIKVDDGKKHSGSISYTYSASGAKLRVKYEYDKNYSSMPIMGTVPVAGGINATKIVDYVGNRIYEKIGTESSKLKRILIDGGYIEENKYYFYLTDHLGNNRVVVDNLNKSIQNTHYYPFGMPFADSNNPDKQPYKYNNKELDSELGLDSYDYVARMLGVGVPRFWSMDPHAEKYYGWSPYMYCYNNPMKYVDLDGRDPGKLSDWKQFAVDAWNATSIVVSLGLQVSATVQVSTSTVGVLLNPGSVDVAGVRDGVGFSPVSNAEKMQIKQEVEVGVGAISVGVSNVNKEGPEKGLRNQEKTATLGIGPIELSSTDTKTVDSNTRQVVNSENTKDVKAQDAGGKVAAILGVEIKIDSEKVAAGLNKLLTK